MWETFTALLPASVIVVGALICFIGGTTRLSKLVWGPFSLLTLALAALTLCALPKLTETMNLSADAALSVVFDPLASIVQFLSIIIGTLFAGMAFRQQKDDESSPEFYGLLLTVISGLMVVASANDIILLFLGLELISIPTYVLIYLGRRDARCQEAAVKYFLLSVLSAAVLLYGLSFLYGLTGSTNLTTIRSVLQQTYAANGIIQGATVSKLGVVALVLIFAGLGFKLAAVPFHFYAPDVYQGTNAWNAGMLSIIPKAAGLIALIRIVSHTMVGFEGFGQTVALILALVTMTAGNVLALLQTNVRRMLAYSGVAHAGYMLVGVAVGFWDSWNPSFRLDPIFGLPVGIQASLFYLIAYSIVSAGFFAVLVFLARPGKEVEHVEDLTGLWKSQPWLAIAAAIFLFSMAGIPPLPGFWGKLALFGGALSVRGDLSSALPYPNPSFVALAIVGMVNAAIGGVYYLRIIALMFLHDPLSTPQPRGGRPAMAAVTLCAIVTILFGLQSRPILTLLRGVEQPIPVQVATTPLAQPLTAAK